MNKLCCIGQATIVKFLHLQRFPVRKSSEGVLREEVILGNDACITALLATLNGTNVAFWSNPVCTEVLSYLQQRSRNRSPIIFNVSGRQVGQTSYCLHEIDGTRTWLPANIPVPDPRNIPNIEDFDLFYIDFYDELAEVIVAFLRSRPAVAAKSLLNFSSTGVEQKLNALKGIPNLLGVQVSVRSELADAKGLAAQIVGALQPTAVICSLGENGSILHTDSQTRHVPAPVKSQRKNGAGAALSAAFLEAIMCDSADLVTAHEQAVSRATEFCVNGSDIIQLGAI